MRAMIEAGHLKFCANGQDVQVVNPHHFWETAIQEYTKGDGKPAFKKQLNNYGFYQVRTDVLLAHNLLMAIHPLMSSVIDWFD
jgi:hypothetical protein